MSLKDYLDSNFSFDQKENVYHRKLATTNEIYEEVFPLSETYKWVLTGKVSFLEIELKEDEALKMIQAYAADKTFYAKAIEVLSKNKHINGLYKAGENGGFSGAIIYINKAYLPPNIKTVRISS